MSQDRRNDFDVTNTVQVSDEVGQRTICRNFISRIVLALFDKRRIIRRKRRFRS